MTYKVIRMYQDGKQPLLIRTGLTLELAREHCRDNETSSSTCTTKAATNHTDNNGQWFDGYEKE